MKIIDVFLLLFMLMMSACRSDSNLQDPFWGVNPLVERNDFLNELSSNPDVERSAFSYQMNLKMERKQVKMMLNCWATQPQFDSDDRLTNWRYTISPDFYSEVEYLDFNRTIYEQLKQTWISSYGDAFETVDQEQAVILKWILKTNLVITITVNKQFNSYLVEYKQSDKSK